MPIFRGSKGDSDRKNPDDTVTQVIDKKIQGIAIDDLPTVINDVANENDSKTILFSPGTEEADALFDPVIGWLVVIKGPGAGNSLILGFGKNTIGRSKSERICLDFGTQSDSLISREKHAIITYDPKGKKYYVQSGDSINLTYLNGDPVLTPTELVGGEDIVLGETTLRFIPFCGEDFDWQTDN